MEKKCVRAQRLVGMKVKVEREREYEGFDKKYITFLSTKYI